MDLEPVGAFVRDGALAVVHHDEVADGLERLEQRPQQRGQRPVDEDHLVLGVVRDVGELLGEQADVQRVEHAPRAGRREVELEVTCRVPREGRDPPVVGDAEVVEHSAQPTRALGPGPVRGALDPRRRRGDDLLVGEQLLGPAEQVRDRERVVLHQALHERSPESSNGQ